MSEFTRLNLVREKIDPTIESCFENCKIQNIKTNRPGDLTYTILVGTDTVLLAIYHNSTDETTSINYKVGRNHELSKQLAQEIKDKCSRSDHAVTSFYIKKIAKADFETVIEFLVEKKATIEHKKEVQAGVQYSIKGEYGGHLVIRYYNNDSFQVQGKAVILFNDIIEILTTVLPFKEVIEHQLKYYSVNMTSGDILGEMENRIPSAFPHLNDTLKAIISPVFALRKLKELELADYSSFAFPILRGLEGVLKELMAPCCIVKSHEGFGEFFDHTSPIQRASLKIGVKADINDSQKVKWIEDLYTFFKAQRHSLFHVDNIQVSTRILNRNEAELLINNGLNLLEQAYAEMNT